MAYAVKEDTCYGLSSGWSKILESKITLIYLRNVEWHVHLSWKHCTVDLSCALIAYIIFSSSIEKVSKIPSPVLIIHGTEDEVIDFSHGLALFERCPKAVEPLWVEGAGHNDIELYSQYLERLRRFINQDLAAQHAWETNNSLRAFVWMALCVYVCLRGRQSEDVGMLYKYGWEIDWRQMRDFFSFFPHICVSLKQHTFGLLTRHVQTPLVLKVRTVFNAPWDASNCVVECYETVHTRNEIQELQIYVGKVLNFSFNVFQLNR